MEEGLSKGKKALIVCSVIALVIILVIVGIFGYFFVKFEKLNKEEEQTQGSEFDDVLEDDEAERESQLVELRGKEDLSSILKNWAVNSSEEDLMHDDNVINFLLIGLDESELRSDTMIILSLDKRNGIIYMHSVFRDCYTYINSPYGDRWAKINAAYSNGGAKKLVETIENDFKIKIDNYVSVNFWSFKRIVDIMGGIELTVQPYEAEAIGNGCPSGCNVLLNGEQALSYCRIRYCDADGDVSRTRRQRLFIMSVIDRVKDVKLSQVSDILDTLLQYVKTDCSSAQLVKYATQALISKWYTYEIKSESIPAPAHRMDYMGYSWVWIVDYPSAAKELQRTLYGKTNIELLPDRVSAIDIMNDTEDTGEAHP